MLRFDFSQIKRFILSGGVATLVHLASMGGLVSAGLNPIVSTSVGVILGAITNYILQYYYTFDADDKHMSSGFKYIITVGISFVSNLILFTVFYNVLNLSVISSQLLTSAIVALQNYTIYKYFVFLRKEQIFEV